MNPQDFAKYLMETPLKSSDPSQNGSGGAGGGTTLYPPGFIPDPPQQQQNSQYPSGFIPDKQFSPDNPYAPALKDVPPSPDQVVGNWVTDAYKKSADLLTGGAASGITGTAQAIGNAFTGGVSKVGQGVGELAGGLFQNPFDTSGKDPTGQGIVKGFNDIVGGGAQTVFSPLEGLPQGVKDVAGAPFKWLSDAVSNGLQNHGIDPNSQAGKNIVDSINNAAQLIPIAAGMNSELNKTAQTAGEVDNFKSQLPQEAQGQFEGMQKSDIAKTPEFKDWQKQQSPGVTGPIDQKKFEGNLLKNGMPESYANRLGALSQENPGHLKTFQDYLQTGLERSKSINPEEVPRVLDIPGAEVEDFYKKAQEKLNQIGEDQDAAKENLAGKTIDTTPIQNKFQEVMKKLNIGLTDPDGNTYKPGEAIPASSNFSVAKTSLDFSKSELKGGGTALQQLQGIWQDVQNNPQMDARDAEALTGQIDNITGQLKEAGFKTTRVNTVLGKLKTAINQSVGATDETFSKLNTQYAQLVDSIDPIKNAITSKLKGGDEVISGSKLFDNLLKSDPAKAKLAIDAMQQIEKDFKIEAPKDIGAKAVLADMAEKLTSSSQSRSVPGIMQAIRMVPGGRQLSRVIRGAQAVQGQFNPDSLRAIEKNVGTINDIINNANKPGGPQLSAEHLSALQDTLKNLGSIASGTSEKEKPPTENTNP